MIDFSKVLEADLSAQSGSKPKQPALAPGFYNAIIQKSEPTLFKSGAKGLVITYMITDGDFTGRNIRENIVTNRADGSDLQWGYAKVKQRLFTSGFSAESLKTFRAPKSDKDLGDYVKMVGKPVKIELALKSQTSGPFAGTQRAEVVRVSSNTMKAA
jgi:hypothetical protein